MSRGPGRMQVSYAARGCPLPGNIRQAEKGDSAPGRVAAQEISVPVAPSPGTHNFLKMSLLSLSVSFWNPNATS